MTLHRLLPRTPMAGEGVPVTIRVPKATLAELDAVLAEGVTEIRSRSEALNDALSAWLVIIRDQGRPVDG